MKLGVNLWTVYGWRPTEPIGAEILSRVADMGAEAIELVVDAEHNTAEILIDRRDELSRVAADLGLAIPSVGTTLFWQYNLGSQDADNCKKGIELMRDGARVSASYGADVFLVVAAQQEPDTEYGRTYETAVRSVREGADFAADLGITIGIENVKTSFIGSPGEFAQFLDDVDHPSVKAYVDFGNGAMTGPSYPENWITAVRGRIASVHCKDYDRILDAWVACGQGSLDWDAVFAALRDVGYDGYIHVETPPKAGKEPGTIEAGLHAAETSLRWLAQYV